MEKEEKPRIKYNSRKKQIPKFKDFDDFIKTNQLSVYNGENTIVLLTKENAEIIEKLVEGDDEYFPFSKIIFGHFGLKKVKNNIDKAFFAIAREIDRDNNTNVWRYKKNRENFYKMIDYVKSSQNSFWEELEKGELDLPDKIVAACGTQIKSLSSKICKYLCEFAFQKDNYYINDSYVRGMLLFYLDFYGVGHPELKSIGDVNNLTYKELYNWLEKLHRARNYKHDCEITKSELDHILWYCYKMFVI